MRDPAAAKERPQPHPAVSVHVLDDELVLYDSRRSETYVLNATASYLWGLCDGTRTVTDLAHALGARYGLPESEALSDVAEFVAHLHERSLLSPP